MAKLTLEWGDSVKMETEVDDSVCDGLWRFEKERLRGRRENTKWSWRNLMAEIFDTFLKSKGY